MAAGTAVAPAKTTTTNNSTVRSDYILRMSLSEIQALLRKHEALTREELNQLRAGFADSYCIGDNQTYVMARVSLELIDRIIHLDDASAALINITNKLTERIFWLTVVGVGVGVVGVILAAIEVFHRS